MQFNPAQFPPSVPYEYNEIIAATTQWDAVKPQGKF